MEPSFSSSPFHLRAFLFDLPLSDVVDDLLPPPPTHIRPSAVPAATTPKDEIDMAVMKGGTEEIPGASPGVAANGTQKDVLWLSE